MRRLGLLVAALLVVGLDLALRRLDLLTPLVPPTLPATLFAAVNAQLVDVARSLRAAPAPGPSIALLGNSQMDLGLRPLPRLRDELARAGAPADLSLLPLFVYASTLTDAEVIAREIGTTGADLVVLGVSAPDLGTPASVARSTPVARVLDTGFADGPLPPADLEARLDRWARTIWRGYRDRTLFAELLLPGDGRRVPRDFYDRESSKSQFFTAFRGEERAREIAALRPGFEAGDDWAAAERYVQSLQGATYVSGLRDRWRALEVQPEQLAALHLIAGHVARAGARLVLVLVPENPLLERDPEVGAIVRARSDAAADALRAAAAPLGVEVVDLRHGFAAREFLDLNHLFFQHGHMAPALAEELGRRGLLPVSS